jgi:probable rRNA maturation factor
MSVQAYPELTLSLQWANPSHKALLPRHAVMRAIRQALKAGLAGVRSKLAVQAAEMTVRVVGSEEARALNQQFRGLDYATNVLTFNYSSQPVLCADIVLCAPVLAREAIEQSKDLCAHYVHMLVHGALHALGLDHERSTHEAQRMEALEVLILQGLGYANPYEA